jgi:hypothetical protein
LTESLIMAIRAITEGVRFCGLGDLTSLDFRNDEAGPESAIRFINFSGNTQLSGLASLAIRGRVVVHRDDTVHRWVPVNLDIYTEGYGLAVEFGERFDRDGCLDLDLVYMACSVRFEVNPDSPESSGEA